MLEVERVRRQPERREREPGERAHVARARVEPQDEQRHEQHDPRAARGRGRGGERARPGPAAGSRRVERARPRRAGRGSPSRARRSRAPPGRARRSQTVAPATGRPSSSSTSRCSSHSAPAKHASETTYAETSSARLRRIRQDERPDEQRVEREERGVGAAVVAVVRDPEVPDAVPAGERREEDVAEAAERMRERRVVELRRVRAARPRRAAATRTAPPRRPARVTRGTPRRCSLPRQVSGDVVTAIVTVVVAIAIAEVVDRTLARRGTKLTEGLSPVANTRLRLVRRLIFAAIVLIGVGARAEPVRGGQADRHRPARLVRGARPGRRLRRAPDAGERRSPGSCSRSRSRSGSATWSRSRARPARSRTSASPTRSSARRTTRG